MTILLATTNLAKQDALRSVLDGLSFTPVTPTEVGIREHFVNEDRPTHKDNAELKAEWYAAASSKLAIGSDGGLEIPALDEDWNALHTRRFAGPQDEDRITALLDLMRGVPVELRMARFHEAVAVVTPDGRVIASVECAGPWGRIAEQADPRALPGFWIPALFLYPPRWVTEWDLTQEERVSERSAWDMVRSALRPALRCYLNGRAC